MKLMIQVTVVALLSVAVFSTSGCKSGMDGVEELHVAATDNGAIAVDTLTVKATVVAMDMTKGTITLMSDSGAKQTYKVGKDVVDVSMLNAGDKITVVVTEEIAVAVGLDLPDDMQVAGGVMIAPDGSAAGTVVESMNVTGVVASVDAKKHKVTFTLEDGSSKTVKVRKDLDLALLPVGQTVTVQVGQGIAVSVDK